MLKGAVASWKRCWGLTAAAASRCGSAGKAGPRASGPVGSCSSMCRRSVVFTAPAFWAVAVVRQKTAYPGFYYVEVTVFVCWTSGLAGRASFSFVRCPCRCCAPCVDRGDSVACCVNRDAMFVIQLLFFCYIRITSMIS
jgi:hypothetical protein